MSGELRVQADAYGVRVDLRVKVTAGTTPEELDRALSIAATEARARHAATAR